MPRAASPAARVWATSAWPSSDYNQPRVGCRALGTDGTGYAARCIQPGGKGVGEARGKRADIGLDIEGRTGGAVDLYATIARDDGQIGDASRTVLDGDGAWFSSRTGIPLGAAEKVSTRTVMGEPPVSALPFTTRGALS